MPTKATVEAVLLATLDHLANVADKDAAKLLLNEILNPPPPKKERSKKQCHV